MPEKKTPGRFTISLNLEDPIQREVAEVINRQGPRRKAQFIVNAISHYIHCSETPVIQRALEPAADSAAIEAVILHVLAEKGLLREKAQPQRIAVPIMPIEQEKEVSRQAEELLGEKGVSAIQSTIAAFRRR